MSSQLVFVKQDFDGDAKQVSWETLSPDDYADYAAYLAAMNDLDAIIDSWSIGRSGRAVVAQELYDEGVGGASNPVAQGNLRVILEGQETLSGIVYKFPIPMPDLTKANDGGGDPAWIRVGQGSNSLTIINPNHADYATLKTRFDANVLSPNGNPVVLIRAYVEE